MSSETRFLPSGPVTALRCVGRTVVAGHADGSLSATVVQQGKLSGVTAGTPLSASRAALSGVSCALVDSSPCAVACCRDGSLHVVGLSETGEGPAWQRSSAPDADFDLSCVDWQQSASGGFIAAGDARRGSVRIFSTTTLDRAAAAVPLWSGAVSGGRGPGVTAVRWWPYSASNLLAAAGGHVFLLDARAPSLGLDQRGVSASMAPWPALCSRSGDCVGGSSGASACSYRCAGDAPGVFDVCLSPEDPYGCFGGCEDGRVAAWDMRRPGAALWVSGQLHDGPVWALVTLPASVLLAADGAGEPLLGAKEGAGCVLATAGEDGAVRCFRFPPAADGATAARPAAPVHPRRPLHSQAQRLVQADTALGGLAVVEAQPGEAPGPSCGLLVAGGDSGALFSAPMRAARQAAAPTAAGDGVVYRVY